MSSAALKSLLLLFAVLHAGSAAALEVSVDAPDELRPLLEQHLETARAARLKEVLSEEEIARLQRVSLDTARDLLATEGYFSPQIKDTLERTGDDWRVRYQVNPGPRTMVRTVSVTFAGAVSEDSAARQSRRERIERSFALQPGMPFRQADWDKAKSSVLRPLQTARYPAARIAESAARIDPEAAAADLSVLIDSGPVFFIGPVRVSGSQRYPESIIRNYSPLDSGKPYHLQDLLDYQTALEASGYFSQSSVRIDPDAQQASAAPILVEVVERPAKTASFGVGVNTDSGAHVQSTLLHRNLLNQGLRLKLDAKIETSQQEGIVELARPRNPRGYDESLGLRLRHSDIEGEETRSWALTAKRTRTRGQIEATLAVQYQNEEQTIGDVLSERNQALTATYSWTKRNIGRAFYPRSGYVLNLQGGGAVEALLSDTTFLRLYGRHTQYFRLGDHGRLVLRGELGAALANSSEGIPTDFLFRAGGDNSVRGYDYQSLGLTLPDGVESVRYLATASVEYNYFFNRTWGMALFVDAGDAADSPSDLSPVFGPGVGARYNSPVGPINLDLAYGEAVDEFRLHFSLGVSF